MVNWRWLILGLLAIIGVAVVVLGQHVSAPQPQQPQVARLPPSSQPEGPRDEASAGTSGPRDQKATARETQTGPDELVLRQDGQATYYADKYQGQRTASGERFDQETLTAASHALPLGARATVIHRANRRSVDVTINDRGPHVEGRLVDLSKKAAEQLGITEEGVAPVQVEARPSQQPTPELAEKVSQEAQAQARKSR